MSGPINPNIPGASSQPQTAAEAKTPFGHIPISEKLKNSQFGKTFGPQLQKEMGILFNNMINEIKKLDAQVKKEKDEEKRNLQGEG